VSSFLAWAAVIAAFSGWAAVLYDRLSQRPKIRGRVFQVIKGVGSLRGRQFTSIVAYLHLTNSRRNPISVLEYELEAFVDEDWTKLQRSYGANLEEQVLTDASGAPFRITRQTMVNWKPQAIAHGIPLQGFIQFLADERLYAKRITAWRLTLVDEFDNRHVISTSSMQLGEPFRMMELAHIVPTPHWVISADNQADAAHQDSHLGKSDPRTRSVDTTPL
jgi:hypothetical protein